jgi:hypothetical protein
MAILSSLVVINTDLASFNRSLRQPPRRRNKVSSMRSSLTMLCNSFRMYLVTMYVHGATFRLLSHLTVSIGHPKAFRARDASSKDCSREHDGGSYSTTVTTDVWLSCCAEGLHTRSQPLAVSNSNLLGGRIYPSRSAGVIRQRT